MDRDVSGRKGFSQDDPLAEEILELRALYIEYLRGEIDTFRFLLARRDLSGIRELGHRLKGSGGSYGFDHISELGENIQNLPDRAEWEEIERLFNRLEEIYEKTAEGL